MLLKLTRSGMVIHRYAEKGPSRRGRAVLNGLGALLTGVPAFVVTAVGDGCGALTERVMAAMTPAAQTEGIVLDPIYTGRAMAGLLASTEADDIVPGQHTILLHSGGLPGLFGHPATLARAAAALTAGGWFSARAAGREYLLRAAAVGSIAPYVRSGGES
ncbi:hypothetical protein [Streptomyces sp. NPDC005283]|uniref:hypothetical protein n=1 Tax=Streptomyces sp. NPDC005283 TaxID=3156871 RepID=UPI003453CD51